MDELPSPNRYQDDNQQL